MLKEQRKVSGECGIRPKDKKKTAEGS